MRCIPLVDPALKICEQSLMLPFIFSITSCKRKKNFEDQQNSPFNINPANNQFEQVQIN